MSNKPPLNWGREKDRMRGRRASLAAICEAQRLSRVEDEKAPGGHRFLSAAWRGLSAHRHIFSVDRLDAETLTHSEPCVALAVARDVAGAARVLGIRADIHPSEIAGWVERMAGSGATELHRCTLGKTGPLTARERLAVALDLTAEEPAPARAA
ncbi:hypothetical protein [Methylorubrum extorquens]|uniref:Uncharacterized protein n=1 Tax=Methylorubrum extorquens (strain CM4 / NCIMB 13688) TaxID=440085 RepID=B7KTG6_METC4|nr:hypothetical protein [Methylorubrum extorquens]ACK82493.1 hypothetical protein Mchl_1629 [Methylorubrum extorquens CM4]